MPYSVYILLLPSLWFLTSCHRNANRFEWTAGERTMTVCLTQESDSLYTLHLTSNQPTHTTWQLPYPVYRFDYGDVTGNGIPEIIVGVIKPTRFDPRPAKRLFIYRIADGTYIRPLWLGSRVAQPLEDFHVDRRQTPARICTTERLPDGQSTHAEYIWKGFGLQQITADRRHTTAEHPSFNDTP